MTPKQLENHDKELYQVVIEAGLEIVDFHKTRDGFIIELSLNGYRYKVESQSDHYTLTKPNPFIDTQRFNKPSQVLKEILSGESGN